MLLGRLTRRTLMGASTAIVVGCSSVSEVMTCSVWSAAEFSDTIGTVATVRWRVNGVDARRAHVEFWPTAGGATLIAPAPLTGDGPHRAVLLGMKPNSEYAYRISIDDGACVSEPRVITTRGIDPRLPRLTFEVGASLTPGFYILSSGFGGDVPGGSARLVYIVDQDGDPVWWWGAPAPISRATMDWEGERMYMLALNVGGAAASFSRVNMDGTSPRELGAIGNAHHDFTVTPGGRVVAIVHVGKDDGVAEYDPDAGTLTPLVSNVATLYNKGKPEYHANSITYRPDDDSFILGDRFPNLYVKFDRRGQLVWQFGGTDPLGPAFTGTGTWLGNHGHHWTGDDHLLVFNNGSTTSRVLDFAVDEPKLEARLVREYVTTGASLVLGDVQRLPNGHVLATYSTSGRLIEYDPDGEVVAEVRASTSLGYTMYRRSLYGPPDK